MEISYIPTNFPKDLNITEIYLQDSVALEYEINHYNIGFNTNFKMRSYIRNLFANKNLVINNCRMTELPYMAIHKQYEQSFLIEFDLEVQNEITISLLKKEMDKLKQCIIDNNSSNAILFDDIDEYTNNPKFTLKFLLNLNANCQNEKVTDINFYVCPVAQSKMLTEVYLGNDDKTFITQLSLMNDLGKDMLKSVKVIKSLSPSKTEINDLLNSKNIHLIEELIKYNYMNKKLLSFPLLIAFMIDCNKDNQFKTHVVNQHEICLNSQIYTILHEKLDKSLLKKHLKFKFHEKSFKPHIENIDVLIHDIHQYYKNDSDFHEKGQLWNEINDLEKNIKMLILCKLINQ